MKKIYVWGLSLISLSLTVSCAPGWKYTASQPVTLTNGVRVEAKGIAVNPDNTIKVELNIKNDSTSGIVLVPGISVIISPEGLRIPGHTFEGQDLVLPGSTARVIQEFRPVNSRWMYFYTGWEGDLEPAYEISLDFIQDSMENTLSTNTIRIEMPKKLYQRYLNQASREPDTTVYQLASNLSNLTVQLEEYYKKTFPTAQEMQHEHEQEHGHGMFPDSGHTLIIQEQEFFLDGILLRLSVYRWKNQASVLLRVSNRKAGELKLDLSGITLKAGEKKFTPRLQSVKGAEQNTQMTLMPNSRVEALMSYQLDQPYDSLNMTFQGLLFGDKEILPLSLEFVKRSSGLMVE